MVVLTSLAEQATIPGGFWAFIWSQFLLGGWSPFAMIINYGVRVIIFTLALKLLLSPLDVFQRVAMRKNQKVAERLKPEIERLEKQYANNPAALQKRKQELNKKNGIKMMAGCLPMIVTMVVSLWLLLGGLNPISQHQNMVQYLHLYDAFMAGEKHFMVEQARLSDNEARFFIMHDEEGEEISFEQLLSGERVVAQIAVAPLSAFVPEGETFPDISMPYTQEAYDRLTSSEQGILRATISARNLFDARIQEGALARGSAAAYLRYVGGIDTYGYLSGINSSEFENHTAGDRVESVQVSFLWVRNIWVADVPWENTIRSSAAFSGSVGNFRSASQLGISLEANGFESQADFEAQVLGQYDRVMGSLVASRTANRRNGLLLLPIISIIVMIGSQLLTKRLQKKSGQQGGIPGMGGGGKGIMGKLMPFVMPLIFGIFAINFTAAFAIYIIMNSAATMLITGVVTLTLWLIDRKKKTSPEVVTETGVIKYGRKDPNAPKVESKRRPEHEERDNKNKRK